ncbi:uncharacterized protein PFL1_02630 [Pseudozyma flocculosa PF-1]|uniref:Uncharacterized protein n=1 Tax=Pseudozyma flocculosa PF-1 TaxID=1277687 RepID=A0A061HBL0_9BASI|nr:uncharacterized protein PFL1_02630 [Pseudozyma flocculosa PF-1]EPQ29958.1 hypothetical protein PFL1_02630 [Pseudozyma flocculosa PF-1]
MAADPSLVDFVRVLRETALEQATARSEALNQRSTPAPPRDSSTANDDGGDDDQSPDGAGSVSPELDLQSLVELYHDERARNDAIQANLHERLAQLVEQQSTRADEQRPSLSASRVAKELELERLDWEIDRLQNDLAHAPEPLPSAVSATTTRAALADLCSQYAAILPRLERQLTTEQSLLASDTQLLADLRIVEAGLRKRLDQVEARLADEREQGSEEVLKKLQRKTEAHDTQMRSLLGQLIKLTSNLFDDRQRVKSMRFFIEELMNRAWDVPQDPYLQVTGPIDGGAVGDRPQRSYEPALVELAVRANFAVQHPRDARKLRLVAFGRPTRARA